MRYIVGPLVLSACSLGLAGWPVPLVSEPIRIEAEGTVEISRSSVQTIRTGSPDAVVSWIGPDGKDAAFGDELMRLDTAGLQREYRRLLDKLVVRCEQATNKLFKLEQDLAQKEEYLALLLEGLQVKTAAVRAAAAPDPSWISTLKREVDLVQREAALQEAELVRKRNMYELGELARFEVEDAELAAEAMRRSIHIARLTLQEAEDGSDPVLARRAAWQVERARISIGTDAEGTLHDDRGYGKKLAAVRSKLARTRSTLLQGIAAHEVELQGLARAAWAHLPLQELRIMGEQGVVCSLQATNAWAAAIYDATRGYGWVEEPLVAPAKGALVIRGQARWRCDLPPGTYRMECILGAPDEWNCMIIKQAGRPLVAINRLLPQERRTCEAELRVGAGGLLLDIGLEHKALLASEAGAVKYQTWLGLGRPIHNNPPALYLTPSAKLLVRFRIHHLQLPFFGNTAVARRRLELQDSTGAWIPGGRVTITDDPVVFFPSKTDNELDGADQRPEERTAREITVEVPAESSSRFAFAAHVRCRAVAEPVKDAVVVPAYLVEQGGDGLYIQRNDELVKVLGHRYDQHFILSEGLVPGEHLDPPVASHSGAKVHRYTGEVVSGSAVPMVVRTRSWARIEDLIPHGSRVAKDDLVITLYRPKENEKAVKAEAKAVAAETRFLEAADKQQAVFLEETSLHAQAVEEEKLAGDRVSENRRQDLATLASAHEAARSAEEELKVLIQRVAKLAGKESTRIAYEDYRRRRDVLELQARSRKLDVVKAFRRADYTYHLADRQDWRRARKELALREAKLALSLEREEVLIQRARSLLEDDVEDRTISRDFETMRFLRAPADGHVFYLKGYNDLAKRNERIDKEFIVWQGLTVAQILDMSRLSFRVSLPESYYYRIHVGMELPIELEDFGDRILTGRIVTKGRTLYRPREDRSRDTEAIGLNRIFDVTLSFAVSEDLRDRLRPGLRGGVILP
ncbi:MAG: hypothetical protein VCG02_09345 [Verrucomicrobiota bacterium]